VHSTHATRFVQLRHKVRTDSVTVQVYDHDRGSLGIPTATIDDLDFLFEKGPTRHGAMDAYLGSSDKRRTANELDVEISVKAGAGAFNKHALDPTVATIGLEHRELG
jgi:hypothetical protein